MRWDSQCSAWKKYLCPLVSGVDQNVWRGGFEGVGREPVADAYAEDARVACGQDIDIRVADNDSFLGSRACLTEKGFDSERIRLLGVEAVAAINLEANV